MSPVSKKQNFPRLKSNFHYKWRGSFKWFWIVNDLQYEIRVLKQFLGIYVCFIFFSRSHECFCERLNILLLLNSIMFLVTTLVHLNPCLQLFWWMKIHKRHMLYDNNAESTSLSLFHNLPDLSIKTTFAKMLRILFVCFLFF